jgi:drug/metabolite transporter (DMT)-like permease
LVIASFDALLPKGQQLSPIGWLGTIIGLAGVVVLVSPSLGLVDGEHLNPLGIVALILACVLWTIGSLYGKYHHVDGNIFVNSGIQNFAPGIVALAIGMMSGELAELHFTTNGVLALAYLIVFGTILGYTSYQYLLRHQPPAKASTYAYVNPIIAVFLGWLILDEPVTLRTVVAAIVILGGVAMVQVSKMRKKT